MLCNAVVRRRLSQALCSPITVHPFPAKRGVWVCLYCVAYAVLCTIGALWSLGLEACTHHDYRLPSELISSRRSWQPFARRGTERLHDLGLRRR